MYEASFDLKRRPFGATPDATCFLAAAPIQAALDEILVCIEQGQGISVLTAPAGVGKTLLCERLRSELNPRFETVFLRHASFLTRRALLQTLLCELNHSYQHASEQELRLALWPAIRELQPEREALVLICDEAHQLSKNLIEELRILADFAESGKPLVRLVLVGQLNLEEKLALPSLEAFNQRIRAHVNLPLFDREGSLDYIDYRLTWAGGRTDEIFTPQALDVIVQASDGVPRCINQLADHTLLLAFVAEQRPAGAELVREALNDLRQLPLHWNEPISSSSAGARWQPESHHAVSDDAAVGSPLSVDTGLNGSHPSAYIFESPASEGELELPSWESSSHEAHSSEPVDQDSLPESHLDSWESAASSAPVAIETQSDDWKHVIDLFRLPDSESDVDTTVVIEDEAPVFNAEQASETASFETVVHSRHTVAAKELRHDEEAAPSSHSALDEQAHPTVVKGAVTLSGASDPRPTESATKATAMIQAGTMSTSAMKTISNTFEEEVIFDRYAAIDAGFVPTFASPTDTVVAPKVHAEPDRTSVVEATEAANEGWKRLELAASSLEDHSVNDPELSDITSPSSEQAALEDHHASLETILTAVHELIELTSHGKSESQLTAIGGETEAVVTASDNATSDVRFDVEDVFDWERQEEQVQQPHYVEADLSLTEEVERTHDSYDAAVKSAWPTSTIPQDEEAILRSLQREIHTGSSSGGPNAPYLNSRPGSETGWAAVETDAVEPTEKARPFRYLFSMLRRKQQQTH